MVFTKQNSFRDFPKVHSVPKGLTHSAVLRQKMGFQPPPKAINARPTYAFNILSRGRTLACLLLAGIFVTVLMLDRVSLYVDIHSFSFNLNRGHFSTQTSSSNFSSGATYRISHAYHGVDSVQKPTLKPVGCQDVLTRSTPGKWVPRQYNQSELDEILTFFNKTRTFHRIPISLQRKDGKCGNSTIGGTHIHQYQALCNPDGATPCCHSNHTCVSLPVEMCRCDGCVDVRQAVHAELANWVPDDQTCKLNSYEGESELCPLLHNLTLHIMGDSFSRQLYIALLQNLRRGHPDGLFAYTNTSRDTIKECDHYYTYFRTCKFKLPTETTACNGSLQIKFTHLFNLSPYAKKMLDEVASYKNKSNTVVAGWLGAWDHYKADANIKLVITPLKNLLENSTWPQVVWLSPHSPSLLKNPEIPAETSEAITKFNERIKEAINNTIPILDSNPFSNGVKLMSYDGSHYGPGFNGVKVQLLLNYINELRHSGKIT